MNIKIIGCGNPLAGDDGVGVHVINQLKTMALPAHVELLEGGTDPINLLEMLRCAEKVVLVDAVKGGGEPGEVFLLGTDQLELDTAAGELSLHQFNLAHVLRLGQALFPREMPRKMVVVGVEAENTDPYNTRLSPAVGKALPQIIQRILKEIF